MKRVAVTGGAGYIGRCTAEVLKDQGYQPILIDNFSAGRRAVVGELTCFDVDLTNRENTIAAFKKMGVLEGVIHFAAKALVGESVERPEEYFRNNILATLNVAEATSVCGSPPLVHSSSCAVYGIPKSLPITEATPLGPVSPYGETKRIAEQILTQYVNHRQLRVLNLRYFNPAGSIKGATLGEAHDPETHLIPNVVLAHLDKKAVTIFGTDYPTPDGTCIRDFIHIEDLVNAHLAAIQFLSKQEQAIDLALNLGAGKGSSVKEVIRTCEEVVGAPIQVVEEARRPGDPPELVASIAKAREILQWEPKRSLKEMLSDHVAWMQGRGRILTSRSS